MDAYFIELDFFQADYFWNSFNNDLFGIDWL